MGFGTHRYGWVPVTVAQSQIGDRTIERLSLYAKNQEVCRAAQRQRQSALDAETLEALVEARELPAGVDQPLLPARPGRVGFRVDVEPQGVPGLAIGRARLVRGPVRHHDRYFMIIGVDSF